MNQIGQTAQCLHSGEERHRIRRNSRTRTSRSVTKCRSEGGTAKRKNIKQMLAEAKSTSPGRDTACDVSSFTEESLQRDEALLAVEMNAY